MKNWVQVFSAALAGTVVSIALSGTSGYRSILATALFSFSGGIAAAYVLSKTVRSDKREILSVGALCGFVFLSAQILSTYSAPGTEEFLRGTEVNALQAAASNAAVFSYAAACIFAGLAGSILFTRFYNRRTVGNGTA